MTTEWSKVFPVLAFTTDSKYFNNIANYKIKIRGKSWYFPIWLWMIDVSVANTWTLTHQFGCAHTDDFCHETFLKLLRDKSHGTFKKE